MLNIAKVEVLPSLSFKNGLCVLDQEAKTKQFSQCPYICPQLLYTKTHKDNQVRFFFVKNVFNGNRNFQNLDPTPQRLTKLKSNEIINVFAISRNTIDRIASVCFYFKDMD